MTATKATTQLPRAEQLERADTRRVKILELITASVTEGSDGYKGYPPTISELAAQTGVSNKQVRTDLAALEAAGFIERDPGTGRGIRVVPQS